MPTWPQRFEPQHSAPIEVTAQLWTSQPDATDVAGIVADTWWTPAACAVQVAPEQEPFGAIVRTTFGVSSPIRLPYWS